jgi:cytochrome P450
MLQNSKYIPWVKIIFDSVIGATMLMAVSSLPVVSSLVNLLLGRFIVRARQAHFKYSADRVDRRLALRTARPDIWTQVLRQEGERALSLDDMHSNADMFMIAGTETTATLVSGLIYYLLMNLNKMRTLQDEIRGTFETREDITMGRLAQLKYLNACIEEGLRMYPPVPIGLPRLTPPGGTAICGEWIPANVSIHAAEMCLVPSNISLRRPFT